MATRKPLVLNSGSIEQLQAGDVIEGVINEGVIFEFSNNSGNTLNTCMAVYCGGADQANAALADAESTSKVIGLATEEIADSATGSIQTSGILTATTGEWDIVTGGSGGLTAGSTYFLDASTDGHITDTAPTGSGNYVTRLGVALSTTDLKINIEPPIKL